ncbi:caspase, EACC1-associated type [Asanoa iriomotensis]|uniref:Peptidase C14 caspase domain-containing protein n=1 Tax=Asanoa iriomotensis TaxID=234613 RepID=A0ABQ4BZY9_9ACTN|nr:caspase family protein [Asanoa iriomotensis]GIF56079.1 hypothetical protein Air01nite_21740 [Asanoa iriomotensis]
MDGQRKALIVAVDEYEQDGLRRLLSASADAEALGRVLGDPEVGGFDVRVIRNEPAHVISSHIEDLFSDARRDDVLLLHFSCHGLKNESGELFFAATNTRPNRLGSTAVPAGFVQRCMRASRSRSVVLLLDCCYGGAFGQGVTVRAAGDVNVFDSFPGGRLGGGRGRAVITASSAMEYAFEGDYLADERERAPSVFTAALVEGLGSGEADRDEDGWVSLNELYDYVFDKVQARNPHQTPSRDVEMQGELFLARSRRRRVAPRPIPADLRAAVADANMFTRLGAVTELRSRLVGDNVPAATGAFEALREIAQTDIRYVAEAAADAVREVSVRAEPAELRFGPDAAAEVVRLLGPPLARSVRARASDEWITVAARADGFAVSTVAGDDVRFGTVTFIGPTGEVVVPVQVDALVPAPTPAAAPPPAPVRVPAPRTSAAAPARERLPWWLVAGLILAAAGLVILNWPGTDHTRIAWNDPDTSWIGFRRPWDPFIVGSFLVLAGALAGALVAGRRALGVVAGSGLFLAVDGVVILLGGVADVHWPTWSATAAVGAVVAAVTAVVARPVRQRPHRVDRPAGTLVLAGGVLVVAHVSVDLDGITWLMVSKGLGILAALVVVTLSWLVLSAGDPRTRTFLAGAAGTYVVLAALDNGESWSGGLPAAFVIGMIGYALVLVGLGVGLSRPVVPLLTFDERPRSPVWITVSLALGGFLLVAINGAALHDPKAQAFWIDAAHSLALDRATTDGSLYVAVVALAAALLTQARSTAAAYALGVVAGIATLFLTVGVVLLVSGLTYGSTTNTWALLTAVGAAMVAVTVFAVVRGGLRPRLGPAGPVAAVLVVIGTAPLVIAQFVPAAGESSATYYGSPFLVVLALVPAALAALAITSTDREFRRLAVGAALAYPLAVAVACVYPIVDETADVYYTVLLAGHLVLAAVVGFDAWRRSGQDRAAGDVDDDAGDPARSVRR